MSLQADESVMPVEPKELLTRSVTDLLFAGLDSSNRLAQNCAGPENQMEET
jgi:hypothetical protein